MARSLEDMTIDLDEETKQQEWFNTQALKRILPDKGFKKSQDFEVWDIVIDKEKVELYLDLDKKLGDMIEETGSEVKSGRICVCPEGHWSRLEFYSEDPDDNVQPVIETYLDIKAFEYFLNYLN